MPSVPLRIAILECDTPIPSVLTKHGRYGQIFTSLLHRAADTLSIPPSSLQITTYDVVTAQEYPSLDDIDGILMSGSKHNSFDNDPWIVKLVEFTKKVLEQRRVRIVGVCFGHQIVGRALGAKVARSEDGGWEVSVTDVELTEKGREVFGRETLAIHQMHRDIVYQYPEGTEQLGYTESCAVQGMYISKRLITVQGHPEFNEEIMRELLVLRHGSGIFNDAQFTSGMERVAKSQDGVVIAAGFLKFLLE